MSATMLSSLTLDRVCVLFCTVCKCDEVLQGRLPYPIPIQFDFQYAVIASNLWSIVCLAS